MSGSEERVSETLDADPPGYRSGDRQGPLYKEDTAVKIRGDSLVHNSPAHSQWKDR